MASVKKRGNSYNIKVLCGVDSENKQIYKYMTWKPDKGMTPAKADKEAEHQAELFEEKCRRGQVLDEGITFAEFAQTWLDSQKNTLRNKTYDRYASMLPRINTAIGHLKLCKIQPPHLLAFYNNLSEGGIRLDTKYKCNISVDDYLKENKLSTAELCRRSGISNTTIISIRKGNNVTYDNAMKLTAALDVPFNRLFHPVGCNENKLSGRTVLHHHRLISVILHTAVQWGMLYSNPCDRTQPPKADNKEAKYIDEIQLAELFEALNSVDITHRTIIRVLALSGMRRGEILGLKWSDFNAEAQTINICRSLQYSPKRGIYEDKTKNESSKRVIRISPSVVQDLQQYKVWQLEQQLKMGTQWYKSDYIFTSETGHPILPDSLSSWFSRFMQKHPQIPYISLHSLRHTNASLQIAAGVPITTVSKRLGHTNAATTGKIYAHAIKSADDKAAEALESIMFGDANKQSKETG